MKRSKTQDTLSIIAKTLPDEVTKIDKLTRLANEGLALLYSANDWTEADCARKQIVKAIQGLSTVAQQMAGVNVALSEAAKKSYDEMFATYEELLTEAAKREKSLQKEAYERGVNDGLAQGEKNGRLAVEAEHQQVRDMWAGWFKGSQVQ